MCTVHCVLPVGQFPVSSVVAQLRPDPLVLLAYLTCMFDQRKAEYDRAEFAEYHNLQVYLHVNHQVRGRRGREGVGVAGCVG
jgi:hypothetical protein